MMTNENILRKVRLLGNTSYTLNLSMAWTLSDFDEEDIKQTIEENVLNISVEHFFMFVSRNRFYVLREHQDPFLKEFKIRIDLSYLSTDLIFDLIEISHRICDIYEKNKLREHKNEKFELRFNRTWGEIKICCLSGDIFRVLYFIKQFTIWARKFVFREKDNKKAL